MKRKNNETRLTHEQYFQLRKWMEDNRATAESLTYQQIIDIAKPALGFAISVSSIGEIVKNLGWPPRKGGSKPGDPQPLEDRIATLEAIVRRLGAAVFPAEPDLFLGHQ